MPWATPCIGGGHNGARWREMAVVTAAWRQAERGVPLVSRFNAVLGVTALFAGEQTKNDRLRKQNPSAESVAPLPRGGTGETCAPALSSL